MEYEITCVDGEVYKFTPEQVFMILLSPTDEYSNWIASISQIVKVCKTKGFPKITAKGIYALILQREITLFRDQLEGGEIYKHILYYDGDDEAFGDCFNGLRGDSKYAPVRQEYLYVVIQALINFINQAQYGFSGEDFSNWAEGWAAIALQEAWEIAEKEDVDITAFLSSIGGDFKAAVDAEIENGDFELVDEDGLEEDEDDRENSKEWKTFVSHVVDNVIEGKGIDKELSFIGSRRSGYGDLDDWLRALW